MGTIERKHFKKYVGWNSWNSYAVYYYDFYMFVGAGLLRWPLQWGRMVLRWGLAWTVMWCHVGVPTGYCKDGSTTRWVNSCAWCKAISRKITEKPEWHWQPYDEAGKRGKYNCLSVQTGNIYFFPLNFLKRYIQNNFPLGK